jgi:predicted MFS family arabinose efflux permease
MDSSAGLAATVGMGVVGVGTLLTMPVLMGALERAQAGAGPAAMHFAAVQSWSISAGCILSLAVARRIALRPLSLTAIACLALADAVTPAIPSPGGLLICRAIAGLAGGVAVSLATARLARLARPERQFGLLVLAQLIFAMAGPLAIPSISAISGLTGLQAAFWTLGFCDLVVAALVFSALPQTNLAGARPLAKANTSRRWAAVALALLAILCLYCGIGAYWPYVERLGEASGLTSRESGHLLGLAAIGGIAGSLTPGFLGARVTRSTSILIAVASLVAAMIITSHFSTPAMFFVGTTVYYFGWYAAVPCFLALLAAIDQDGRPTLGAMALIGIGFGMGSTLAGASVGLNHKVDIAVICAAAASLLVIGAIAVVKRE